MRRNPKLLLLSVFGWLVFLNVGWFHQWGFFTFMPKPSAMVIVFAKIITQLGNPTTLIIATILVVSYLLIYRRDWIVGITMAFGMLVAWWLMDFFKSWWAIPRPIGEHLVTVSDYSYPSGHAMLSLVFYGFIAWYLAEKGYSRGWSYLMLAIAVLVGISRPLLNVHFPGDIIGGWGAGLGWLTILIWLYYQITRYYEKKDV